MAKLFFMGDSITAGAWDSKGGWAQHLSNKLLARSGTSERKHKGFYCAPYNLGIFGDTVADVIRRLDREITARTYGDTPDNTVQLVFAVGVNDSVYLLDEDRNHASDDIFKQDLISLLTLARLITDNITFIGLLPVDQPRTDPCPWTPSLAYRNEHIERFNAMIENFCGQEKLPFISFFDEWKSFPDLQNHFTDGLHPNDMGHEKMAKKIGEALFTEDFTNFHTK